MFPREKWELIRETGVLGLPFDAEWGGLGQDALTMVYVLENLGYGCRDSGLLFSVATQIVSVALPIHKFGSDDAEGALPAPADRRLDHRRARDLRARRRLRRHGDDHDRPPTDGDSLRHQRQEGVLHQRADRRRDHGLREGRRPRPARPGSRAFLVETDTPGIKVGEPIPKMGLNTSPIGELEFDDCRVPKENLIGKPGGGFFILEHVMTWEILCIFIMMVGEMQHRLEALHRKFAKTRKQFGEPIGVEPVHRRARSST